MKTDFTRKDNTLKNNESGEVQVFKSINAAKRESRKLQQAGSTVSVKRTRGEFPGNQPALYDKKAMEAAAKAEAKEAA